MRRTIIALAAGVALAAPATAPVLASDISDEVELWGACSSGSQWQFEVDRDDDGTEVEFEVDSKMSGQAWEYMLSGPNGELASGTAFTDEDGEFEVTAFSADGASSGFTAFASTAGETCDSSVGVLADNDDDEYDDEDGDDSADHDDSASREDDVDEGVCSDGSSIALVVKNSGKSRVATLSIDGKSKGQQWRYKIKRGNKVVHKGSARTKGKRAALTITTRAKGKGLLTADAHTANGSEACTTDDEYDY